MQSLQATWYLFGAQAVALHGAQRLTQDIDVTVLTDAPNAEVVTALKKQKIQPRESDPEFIAATRVIPCDHLPSGWKVDVVLGGPGLEQVIGDEAAEVRVGRVRARVIRVEHLLVLKVLAGRPQDLADVDRLLRARADIAHDEVIQLLAGLQSELGESRLVEMYEKLRSERWLA